MGIRKKSDWKGQDPFACEVCMTPIHPDAPFIDGKTQMGPWTIMCAYCHGQKGCGLGTGKGQRYE